MAPNSETKHGGTLSNQSSVARFGALQMNKLKTRGNPKKLSYSISKNEKSEFVTTIPT